MRRVLAIFSASILLASTSSFTIGTHYCGGEAVLSRIMLIEKHLNCGIPNMYDACREGEASGIVFNNVPCCENHYHTYLAEHDYIQDVFQVNTKLMPIDVPLNGHKGLATYPRIHSYSNSDLVPPLLARDIPVLYQSFLI